MTSWQGEVCKNGIVNEGSICVRLVVRRMHLYVTAYKYAPKYRTDGE